MVSTNTIHGSNSEDAPKATSKSQESQSSGPSPFTPPSISLPKGGGAIRGMGEKFAANPVTGTGSMTVPIAVSPGRSGFGPQLTLTYNSGGGNGPFGFGWNLSLPALTRKTDKGLPQYHDSEDSDVFILSSAEDLVPVFRKDANCDWVRDDRGNLVIHEDPRTVDRITYQVRRYRPRIEGLFAHIERWTNPKNPEETFWRSISKDNITTWYGRTPESRIRDHNDAVVVEVMKVRMAQKVFSTMALEMNSTDIPNDVIDFTDLSIKEGQAKQSVEICQEFPLAITQVSTEQDDVVFSAVDTRVKKN